MENGGIVGRGVLLDYAAWAEVNGVTVNCFQTQSIPLSVLQQVAASQNSTFRPGDILFIRTGWTRDYERLSRAECQQLADYKAPPVIGVESSEDMLRWIWDNEFAAVAGDMPSFEAYPCQNPDFFLHEWLLAGWGLPIGELFDLERLSQECRQRKRWSFFFSSVPLKVSEIDSHPEAWLTISGPRRRCESAEWCGHLLISASTWCFIVQYIVVRDHKIRNAMCVGSDAPSSNRKFTSVRKIRECGVDNSIFPRQHSCDGA